MVVLLVILVLAAAAFGVGWVLSSRVIVPAPYSLMPEFEIVSVEAREPGTQEPGAQELGAQEPGPQGAAVVTLPVVERPNQHADTEVTGAYGLLWDGGYGRLGDVLGSDVAGGTITRDLSAIQGAQPNAGAPARIDNFVYRRDPMADFGIPFEELELQGEQGHLRAWYVPGEGRTAVLLVHGRRRGELIETLRMIEPLNRLGFDVLALAYRNHDRSAPSSDGLYHYGASEWRDVITGAQELAARGADRLVLYGLSMGGAVVLEALERWTDTLPEPLGLILDSPLVDPYATVEVGAAKLGLPLPALLTRLGLLVAGWRTGVDFGALRQAESAAAISVPTMVIAGVADTTIPIASLDEFTAAIRTPLTYHRLPGVEHVEAWNHDPEAYEEHLRAFFASLEVRAERR